ncbi:MAG: DMT family transporter [Sporichthya sp.]|nr:DMT family transporter [Sporichthya sp.]
MTTRSVATLTPPFRSPRTTRPDREATNPHALLRRQPIRGGTCAAAVVRRVAGPARRGCAARGRAGLRRPGPPRSTWPAVGLLASVNVTVAFAAMFVGTAGVTSGVAAVLANAQPLLIVLPAWAFYHERPGSRALTGLMIGFVGLIVTATPGGTTGDGALLSLAAGSSSSAGSHWPAGRGWPMAPRRSLGPRASSRPYCSSR